MRRNLTILLFFCLSFLKSFSRDLVVENIKLKKSFDELIDHGFDLIESNLDSAGRIGHQSKKLAFEIGDSTRIAYSYRLLSIVYKREADFDKSFEYGETALRIYRNINDTQGALHSLNSVALTACNQGEYVKAIQLFEEATDLLDSDSTLDGRGKILCNKGKVFYEVGLPIEAKKSLLESNKIWEEENKPNSLTYSYCLISGVFKQNDQIDSAEYFLKKSLECAKVSGNKLMEGTTIKGLGRIAEIRGDYKEAMSKMKESLDIQINLGDQIEIIRTKSSIADLYLLLNNKTLADQFATEAYLLAVTTGFKEGQIAAAKTLSDLKENEGLYKEALKYHNIVDKRSEEVSGEEIVKQIAISNYKHSLEKEQFEKDKIKYELTLQNKTHNIQLLIISLIAVIILGVGAAIYFAFKNHKIKSENTKVYLNKMLSTKALEVMRNSILFNKISDLIKKGSESFPEDEQAKLRSIQVDIKNAIDSNAWKEFELAFNGVNNNFYKNLEADHPKLTTNERKLCAFLRMDLTTKEISNITFQSKHSIEIARSRLRKKLGLSNSQISLYNFLREY